MRKERDRRGWGVEGVRPRLRHRLLILYRRTRGGAHNLHREVLGASTRSSWARHARVTDFERVCHRVRARAAVGGVARAAGSRVDAGSAQHVRAREADAAADAAPA